MLRRKRKVNNSQDPTDLVNILLLGQILLKIHRSESYALSSIVNIIKKMKPQFAYITEEMLKSQELELIKKTYKTVGSFDCFTEIVLRSLKGRCLPVKLQGLTWEISIMRKRVLMY